MVGADLIEEIADCANLQGLGHKLRCAPVEMPIDAVLIAGMRIPEIVGKPGHDRKLVPGFLIEICLADTAIDGAMADAEIGKTA